MVRGCHGHPTGPWPGSVPLLAPISCPHIFTLQSVYDVLTRGCPRSSSSRALLSCVPSPPPGQSVLDSLLFFPCHFSQSLLWLCSTPFSGLMSSLSPTFLWGPSWGCPVILDSCTQYKRMLGKLAGPWDVGQDMILLPMRVGKASWPFSSSPEMSFPW